MKKVILTLTVMLITFRLFSEDFTLTFSATGAATSIEEIMAINLTTGDTVSIPGDGNLILHTTTTNIPTPFVSLRGGMIYPNPFNGSAELKVFVKQAQTISLQLINQTGQILVQKSQYLPGGNHLFSFSADKPGMYCICITTLEGIKNYKAMCIGINSGINSLMYNGIISTDKEPPGQSQLKYTQAGNQLDFNLGDIILYSFRSGFYRTIITDSPTGSKNYSVEFVDCTDEDNNHYAVVKIGNQWWMAENLKSVHFQNSDFIPEFHSQEIWDTLTGSAYCIYNNNPDIGALYGNLYNWFAVMDTRNIAPNGWHIPVSDEVQTLIDNLGGEDIAGGKLKETGTRDWLSPNTGATNESGFSALPGGSRGLSPYGFIHIGETGNWWTSTKEQSSAALVIYISYSSDNLAIGSWSPQKCGLSVRCIKD